jgi:hypothetical protein
MISDDKIKFPKNYMLEVCANVYSYPIPKFIKGPIVIRWGGLSLLSKEEEASEFWDYHIEENMIYFNEELFYLHSRELWEDEVMIIYMEA